MPPRLRGPTIHHGRRGPDTARIKRDDVVVRTNDFLQRFAVLLERVDATSAWTAWVGEDGPGVVRAVCGGEFYDCEGYAGGVGWGEPV